MSPAAPPSPPTGLRTLQRKRIKKAEGPTPSEFLGRMRRTEGPDLGTSVRVPDEIDVQRARRILDELRRRLGDPTRPQLELDYLDRLLPRN